MSVTQKNKKLITLLSALALTGSMTVNAATQVKYLESKGGLTLAPVSKITRLVTSSFDISNYREVKTQVIYNAKHQPDHILVYLFSKKYHSVKLAKIAVDSNFNLISVTSDYKPVTEDFAAQPFAAKRAQCPDTSIEFIAFAPNDNKLEQKITLKVAAAAEKHSLQTIKLLKEDATGQNYLNYMSCPKLKGNFYDGDANPEVITTFDGIISYMDIKTNLSNQFQYKVTNIWLACEAYNDPMLSTMQVDAQSQKYAAGINDLLVGPSDKAAACAMELAMDHLPMTASFKVCYKKYDVPTDQWGFDGKGSDIFTQF